MIYCVMMVPKRKGFRPRVDKSSVVHPHIYRRNIVELKNWFVPAAGSTVISQGNNGIAGVGIYVVKWAAYGLLASTLRLCAAAAWVDAGGLYALSCHRNDGCVNEQKKTSELLEIYEGSKV